MRAIQWGRRLLFFARMDGRVVGRDKSRPERCRWGAWGVEEKKMLDDKPVDLLAFLVFRRFLSVFHAFTIDEIP